MGLRPYQEQAMDAVRARYREGQRAALVVLPTGTGKTRTALTMAAAAIQRGKRVLWLAHRTELIDQPVDAWRALPELARAGSAGVVMAGRNDAGADLVCASVQTLTRGGRLDAVLSHGLPSLVVVDEAHHSSAGQWADVLGALDLAAEKVGQHPPWWLGLTATPERTDRADLSAIWGSTPAYVYTYQDAVDEGYLCPPRFVVDRLPLDDETEALLATASEQGDDAKIAKLLLKAGVVAHTVEAMHRAGAEGRAAMIFTADVEQAELTAAALNEDGTWRARAVSGQTPKPQRRAILRAFKRGEIDVIANCAVLTEGTDLPRCDCIVAARPFSSKPLYVQGVGRGLRLHPGKEDCLVVDLSGASEEHTLIMAAALLETETVDHRTAFKGRLHHDVGAGHDRIVAGSWVWVEPDAESEDAGWRLTALFVGTAIAPVNPTIPVRVPEDVARPQSDSDGGGTVANMWKDRQRVLAEWVACDDTGSAWACDVGRHGLVMLVELEADQWMAYLLPPRARKPQPMGRRAASEEVARSLGDDLFRQAAGLVSSGAKWKQRPPSAKARAYAERLHVYRDGMTAGEVAQAITASKGRGRMRTIGLDGFRAAVVTP